MGNPPLIPVPQDEMSLRAALEEFGEGLINHLALEVDRIESTLRKQFPEVTHIDLESE